MNNTNRETVALLLCQAKGNTLGFCLEKLCSLISFLIFIVTLLLQMKKLRPRDAK